MTEKIAKDQLAKMLDAFTPGTVLDILAGIYRDAAAEAKAESDATLFWQCRSAESALFVFARGIDAVCPR